jgi:hypothetical protein
MEIEPPAVLSGADTRNPLFGFGTAFARMLLMFRKLPDQAAVASASCQQE